MLDDRVSRIALAISLLLHAVLLAPTWQRWLSLSGGAQASVAPVPEPISFRLVDPQRSPPATPTEPTPNVSDVAHAAAQPDAPSELPRGEAYSSWRSPVPSVARPAGAQAGGTPAAASAAPARPEGATAPTEEQGRRRPGPDSAETTAADGEARESRTDPRLALGGPTIGTRPEAATAGDRLPAPEVDQRLTSAAAGEAFSLNTTAWDYAPYMQRLKARIEKHIAPPAAFYYGTAAWISRVRFRILPDGTLAAVELLDHRGVPNLQYVALDAIRQAAAYEPLPPGFPEPYLEITGNFFFNLFPDEER